MCPGCGPFTGGCSSDAGARSAAAFAAFGPFGAMVCSVPRACLAVDARDPAPGPVAVASFLTTSPAQAETPNIQCRLSAQLSHLGPSVGLRVVADPDSPGNVLRSGCPTELERRKIRGRPAGQLQPGGAANQRQVDSRRSLPMSLLDMSPTVSNSKETQIPPNISPPSTRTAHFPRPPN